MRIFGNLIPFIGVVIGPCSRDGEPAMSDEEADAAHHEIKAVCVAWLGRCGMFPFGLVMPRAIDPDNPRQYLAGNL